MQSEKYYISDGFYYSQCRNSWKIETDAKEESITPSGTSALELMAQIIEFQPGDEVILPRTRSTVLLWRFEMLGLN